MAGMPTKTSKSVPRRGMPLAKREIQVLVALAMYGGNQMQLAKVLKMAPLTVKSQKARIARKLGTYGLEDSTAASIAEGFRRGLLNDLVPKLADPDPNYAVFRRAHPYTVRHADGAIEVKNPWAGRPVTADWSDVT